MVFGKVNEEWNHTASLIASLVACHRDPKTDPPTVAQYHPYMPEPEPPRASPEILQQLGFRKVE